MDPRDAGASGQDVTDDRLIAAIDRVEQSGRRTAVALFALIESLGSVRAQRAAGTSISDIAHTMVQVGGQNPRRAVDEAFSGYEHAVMEFRALVIRALVDDGGLSLTEVANRMGISRQMVSRLYSSRGTRHPGHERGERP